MSGSGRRLVEFANGLAMTAVMAALLLGAFFIRATVLGSSFQPTRVDLTALSSREISALAADSLAATLGADGAGLTFDVVQTATLRAKPDGPKIEERDQEDRSKVVAVFDERQVAVLMTTGSVTADEFWMDISVVPPSDFDRSAAQLFARVVENGGVIWRNDGYGWYVAEGSPGVGMDPVSARLLPQLVRGLTETTSLGLSEVDGKTVAGTRGDSRPADFPGVIAADGASFTEATFKVDTYVDDQGRLAKLVATARNLSQEVYDLVIETTISFTYGIQGSPPELTPTLAPETQPAVEADSTEVQS